MFLCYEVLLYSHNQQSYHISSQAHTECQFDNQSNGLQQSKVILSYALDARCKAV
jgi:hypothetical protein